MREFLDTQATVMLGYMTVPRTLAESAAWPPVDPAPAPAVLSSPDAGVVTAARASGAVRFVLRAVAAPINGTPAVPAEGVVLVTDDGSGVAGAIERQLLSAGRTVARVPTTLETDTDVTTAIARVRDAHTTIAAVVHVAVALSTRQHHGEVSEWASAAARDVRFLFLLAKCVREDLERAARQGHASLLAVCAMGGSFASDPALRARAFFPGSAAATGLLKTLAQEWPSVAVRAVDLDPREPLDAMAEKIVTELSADDRNAEVGYAGNRRVAVRPVVRGHGGDMSLQLDSEWVWLVTGGARGITAEVCQELADRYRPTFVIFGQTPLPPVVEDEQTASIGEARELKAVLLDNMRRSGQTATPALVEKAYQQLQREREIRTNLQRLVDSGARVEYRAVDVRDGDAFASAIADVYACHGRIDGVIHGAGIVEDKLVKDKALESFGRVFDTKVVSACVLAGHLRHESLRALVLFSSVAGRFGNRGQGDYGAANEVLNKLAIHLDERWAARVVAINWGPWDKRGMVSDEIKEGFARRGVGLVSVDEGRTALIDELCHGRKGDAEIVIGDGPWRDDSLSTGIPQSLPLLTHAGRDSAAAGAVTFRRSIDPTVDRYLLDHVLDGKPVVPLAMAAELMAEAAQSVWPDMTVSGIRNLRLLKGLVVEAGSLDVVITVSAPVHSPSDPYSQDIDVSVALADKPKQPRYRAVVQLNRRPPRRPDWTVPVRALRPFPLTVRDAYAQWLFHGPAFQRIARIDGIDETGMVARIDPVTSAECLAGISTPEWVLDPLVFDVIPQMAILWSRATYATLPLPSAVGAYTRFRAIPNEPLICELTVRAASEEMIECNATVATLDGEVVCELTGLESWGSAALNRLGGHVTEFVPASTTGAAVVAPLGARS